MESGPLHICSTQFYKDPPLGRNIYLNGCEANVTITFFNFPLVVVVIIIAVFVLSIITTGFRCRLLLFIPLHLVVVAKCLYGAPEG